MPRPKLNKTKLTLYIDKNLLEIAKELGIDINSILEEKLREVTSKKDSMRGPGFEPGLTPRKGVVLPG